MDKFKTVLNIAKQQTKLGMGAVALLTAGGEQIFSSVVFSCPCNGLNFVYGMVFLLVPALALLLLAVILSRKTWRVVTGLCRRRAKLCQCRKLVAAGMVLFQISISALVAPSSWIAVALLNGKYYECAMTGINVSAFTSILCGNNKSLDLCQKELHILPCTRVEGVDNRDDVLHTLKAQSQIVGWLLIASIMLSNLLLNCLARCTSPISYLQLKFWRVYAHEESSLFDSFSAQHAKELAERNLKSFFKQTPPEDINTPSNRQWEKISRLYKFNTNDHHYSTLHRYVENCQETDNAMMRMGSVRSIELPTNNPVALDFVDGTVGL